MIINLLENINHFLLCSNFLSEFAYKIGRFETRTVLNWSIDETKPEEFLTFIFPKKVNVCSCQLKFGNVTPKAGFSEEGFSNVSEKDIAYSYSYDGFNWVEIQSFKHGSEIAPFSVSAKQFRVTFYNSSALKVKNVELLGDEKVNIKDYQLEYFKYNIENALPQMFKDTKIGKLATLFLEM